MIFIPTESLILGCFALAIFFFFAHHKFITTNFPKEFQARARYIRSQLEINRWLGWLFLAAAIAFGITASLLEYPM